MSELLELESALFRYIQYGSFKKKSSFNLLQAIDIMVNASHSWQVGHLKWSSASGIKKKEKIGNDLYFQIMLWEFFPDVKLSHQCHYTCITLTTETGARQKAGIAVALSKF